MATSYEEKIEEQSRPYLEDGERVLCAFIAQPRGTTTAIAGGGAAAALAGRKIGEQHSAAAGAGLKLANPMALALTERRLLVLSVGRPLGRGKGGDVKELVSSAPLAEVQSIAVKRLLVGKTVTIVAGGASFKLEAGAGADAKGLVQELMRLKSGAATART